ncbi:hypothetical protein [Xanthomonas sacchari]|uniref:hypothetical protein n=1 Tax=Xanthomonas sacchari TaxID=56458 RepID=UPI0022555B73|nr:hypothetical protein [Xanthomonas sacchari]
MHDSRHFEQVLDPDNTGRTVWADSGYADAAREADLKRRGYGHLLPKGEEKG